MFLPIPFFKGSNGNSTNGGIKEDEIINLTHYGDDSDDSVKSIPLASSPKADKSSASKRSRSRFEIVLFIVNLNQLTFVSTPQKTFLVVNTFESLAKLKSQAVENEKVKVASEQEKVSKEVAIKKSKLHANTQKGSTRPTILKAVKSFCFYFYRLRKFYNKKLKNIFNEEPRLGSMIFQEKNNS